MQDRRKDCRMRVLKGAKLVVGKTGVLDCIVRNMTDSGARIEVPNAVVLPDQLQIAFDRDGFKRSCRVVWRKLTEAGIEYADVGRLLG